MLLTAAGSGEPEELGVTTGYSPDSPEKEGGQVAFPLDEHFFSMVATHCLWHMLSLETDVF